jgi:hypothetical protein
MKPREMVIVRKKKGRREKATVTNDSGGKVSTVGNLGEKLPAMN